MTYYCKECDARLDLTHEDDVAMCVCGQWHHLTTFPNTPGLSACKIACVRAALLAREPMGAEEVLNALAQGAERLVAL